MSDPAYRSWASEKDMEQAFADYGEAITNQVSKLLIKELLPDICAALLVVMDAQVHLHKNAKH